MLENLKAILTHAGLTLSHIVKTTVFLKDMNDFEAMNKVYAKYFAAAAPAGTTVQATGLPKDALVEIELVAALYRVESTTQITRLTGAGLPLIHTGIIPRVCSLNGCSLILLNLQSTIQQGFRNP